MLDPLYAQVIAWVGLALLLVLCLPFAGIQKLVLEVYAWALRLALLALLGAAAYLWFRPGDLPVQVTDTLNTFPRLGGILPEPGTPHFGICATSLIVVTLLPLLATLDVSRKLAGWRLRRLRALATGRPPQAGWLAAPPPAPPPPRAEGPGGAARAAARAAADAGPRRAPGRSPGRRGHPRRSRVPQAVPCRQPTGVMRSLPWTK